MKGLLVVLEGLGGSGKSTVKEKVKQYFEDRCVKVISTREPGGTPVAEKLRAYCRNGFGPECDSIDPVGTALLLNAARVDHTNKIIKPALKESCIVLCDRFCDSTFAYQSNYNNVNIDKLINLHDLVIGLYPDLTFILDAPARIVMGRVSEDEKKGDQFDRADELMQEKIRQTYLWLASNEPHRYDVIDATQSPEEVFRSMTPMLEALHRSLLSMNVQEPSPYEPVKFVGVKDESGI